MRREGAIYDGFGNLIVDLNERPDIAESLKHGDIRHVLRKLLREGAHKRIKRRPRKKRVRPRLGKVARCGRIPAKILLLIALTYGPDHPIWDK